MVCDVLKRWCQLFLLLYLVMSSVRELRHRNRNTTIAAIISLTKMRQLASLWCYITERKEKREYMYESSPTPGI